MEEQFKQIVEGLADNPSVGGEKLRQLLDSERQKVDLLLDLLCDPAAFTRERAIAVARVAASVESLLDVKLARRLSDLKTPAVEHVLAILDAITTGRRIVPMLAGLMRQTNPRLRSKAILLIGRRIRNPEWAAMYLREMDARARASAVEALWNVDSVGARTVLRKAAPDPNCRVAANATIGLYKLGDPASIAQIVEMSLRPEPAFRSAAAWVMGETGDPRFLPALARMDSGPPEQVRRNISRAIERIKAAEARWLECGRLEAQVTRAKRLHDGSRRVEVAIAPPEGRESLGLLPTQFVTWEDSQLMADYRVQGCDPAEPLAVGFSLCREQGMSDQDLQAAGEAVLACLKYKRPRDSWAVVKHPDDAVRFTTDKAVLAKTLNTPRAAESDATEALHVWSRLVNGAGCLRASRHLVALAGPCASPPDPAGLERLLRAGLEVRAAIHVIAAGEFSPPHPLLHVCRQTGGVFLAAPSTGEVSRLYRQIYSSLLNRYEILYRPDTPAHSAAPARLRLQIYSDYGYGEDSTELAVAANESPEARAIESETPV